MNTAKINTIEANCLGTTTVNMKAGRMRKPQNFTVYPIAKDQDAEVIKIQSGSYWAEIDLSTGEGELSARHSHANSWAFSLDKSEGKTTKFKLSDVDAQTLRMQVFTSASKEAGKRENGMVQTDNSGAINILNL